MANEKVNKVILGNETLIDLTGDTVTANSLLSGATAHDASGNQIQGAVSVPTELNDLNDVNITSPQEGDVLVSDENGVYQNQPKSLYPSAPITTWADYQQLVDNDEDDPDAEYYIDDIDVAEAYYVETSGQTALTGATTLTFTNSHIKPTADIRILAEPASCKVSTNPQYKVSAKLSSVGNGTATITFPALAENTEFWLLIECPLPVTVDPDYVYNTDETVIGQWIDGKPLYRKVITGTLSSPYSFVHNIANLGTIVRLEGYAKSASTTRNLNLSYFGDASWDSELSINATYIIIEAGSSYLNAHTGYTFTVTIEYTKTTD